MRKFVIAAILALGPFSALAQNDEVLKVAAEAAEAIYNNNNQVEQAPKEDFWARSLTMNLGFNQTGLFSWAAGGYNTLTLSAGLDGQANYAKGLINWTNRLQLNYGFLWSADKSNLLQKSNDRIYLESRFAYRTAPQSKWDYTASLDFRTQFSNSMDKYVKDETSGKWNGTLKSGFLSPGYLNLALGVAWNPTKWLNINLAPLTGGVTFCTIPELRKAYGMKLSDGVDPATAVDSDYRSTLFQLGPQIKANAKVNVNDKFSFETQLVLFTDYFNKPFVYNRINWDNKITWNVVKFFMIGLDTWLIYDPLVSIDGVQSKVQFKEFVSISFTYLISNKK